MNDSVKKAEDIEQLVFEKQLWQQHFEDLKKKYYNKRIQFGLDMIKHLTTMGLRGDELKNTYCISIELYDSLHAEVNE